jgi:hypothetical protein
MALNPYDAARVPKYRSKVIYLLDIVRGLINGQNAHIGHQIILKIKDQKSLPGSNYRQVSLSDFEHIEALGTSMSYCQQNRSIVGNVVILYIPQSIMYTTQS